MPLPAPIPELGLLPMQLKVGDRIDTVDPGGLKEK